MGQGSPVLLRVWKDDSSIYSGELTIEMPSDITAILNERIVVDLVRNRLKFQRDIMQRALAASRPGEVMQPGRFFAAVCGEMSKIGNVIAQAIERVLASVEVPNASGIRDQLLQIFDSHFDPILATVRNGFAEALPKLSGNPAACDRFDQHAEEVRRDKKNEIKLLVEKNMKEQTRRPAAETIVIIQRSTVGSFQLGEHNSLVDSTINVGTAEKESLRIALQFVIERLSKDDSLTEIEKSELLAVSQQADAELAKPQPNGTLLRGLLGGLLAGIKGLSTMAAVYEILKVAAFPFGVHLP
jgi:hypothetical protein